MVTHARYHAPDWGVGELWSREGRLVTHELPRNVGTAGHSSPTRDDALARRFAAYFAGGRDEFADVELDLDGSRFEHAVADAMRAIGYGEVRTYGEVAARAGYARAQRAVGSFCARNRFALVVPCHRVVAAHGIGPYGSLGSEYKRRLLELEGVSF